MILAILGASGSGKSSLEKILSSDYGFQKIIPYTTRGKRPGEENNKDYIFTDNDTFQNLIKEGLLAEWDEYSKNRMYGTLVSDYLDGDKVVVLTPNGLRQLKENLTEKQNIFSILIEASLGTRIKRYINRCGVDSFTYEDKNEIASRVDRDWSMFLGVNREVDIVIYNDGHTNIYELAHEVATKLKREKDK